MMIKYNLEAGDLGVFEGAFMILACRLGNVINLSGKPVIRPSFEPIYKS